MFVWARKKCSILTHEIYIGHCPKIKYQIVSTMRFRDIFEAVSTVKAYLFAGRPCEWDSCSFCRNISISEEWARCLWWGEKPSTALRIPLSPFSWGSVWGSPWTFVLWTWFWKGLSRPLSLVRLVSPQGCLVKVLTLCPFEETQHATDVLQYLSSPPCPIEGHIGPHWVVVVSDQGVSIFAVVKMPPETSARILVRRYTEVLAGQTANSRLISPPPRF